MIEGIRERFKHKNIEQFLKKLYPFNAADNSLIALEVIRLCSIIRPEYRSDFPEIDFLISEAQKHKLTSNTAKLHNVLTTIKVKKQLGIHYLPAFLTSDLLLTSYDHQKFDQYKALSFLCAARLSFIGTHQPKIKAICDDVRQFSLGHRENMSAYLPDIYQLNFPQLVVTFNKLVNEENENKLATKVINQLNNYRRPYESSLNYTDGYSRNVTSNEFKKSGRLEAGELKTLDSDGKNVLFELRQFDEAPKSITHSWQKEDHHGESYRTTSIVSIYNHAQNGYAAGALNARAIQSRIMKRDMSLACDIESMTNFEVGSLVRYCLEQIKTDTNAVMTAKLLLIMLFTGSTYRQAQKIKPKRAHNKKIVGFRRKHKLPSLKQRNELIPLLPNVSDEFWLPLPPIICQNQTNLAFSNVADTNLKNLLSNINKLQGTHLTLRKVSSYLKQKLSHENIDTTMVALITGAPIKTIPAIYYLQLSSAEPLRIYNRYLDFLSNFSSEPSSLTQFEEVPLSTLVGSPLHLSTDLLSSLFFKLQSNLKSQHKMRNSDSFHNNITTYTQLVLSLASGYRPVTGWFGKMKHLSLLTGDYWISDKESGVGDNSRVIKLPETARQVLRFYLKYCDYRLLKLSNDNPSLSREYQQILKGENHLFFYLKDDQLLPCTPANYSYSIDSEFPLQANWARHHIRTLLTNKQVDSTLINAWMGHMNQAKRSFHSFSSLTSKQMMEVSYVIDEHLRDIGVEVPE